MASRSDDHSTDDARWSAAVSWCKQNVILVAPLLVLLILVPLLVSPFWMPSISFPSYSLSAPPQGGDVACVVDSQDELSVERGMLALSEEMYKANLEKRKSELRALQPPAASVAVVTEKTALLVPTYPCPREERIGRWSDGGKWMCRMKSFLPPSPIVYSIGSNNEYSFEEYVAKELNTKAFTFDPFIPPQAQHHMRGLDFLSYAAIGLASEASIAQVRGKFPQFRFETLKGIMSLYGHSHIDVFKIDCEGCEETVLFDIKQAGGEERPLDVPGSDFKPMPMPEPAIGQILVEMHKMDKPSATLPMVYHLENIGYRMFHVEPNPQCIVCVEIAFIHESLLFPAPSNSSTG